MPYTVKVVSVSGLKLEKKEDKGDNLYYVQIKNGDNKVTTAKKERGSREDVVFGDEFTFDGGCLDISVKDKDTYQIDDVKTGHTKLDLSKYATGTVKEDVVIHHHLHRHVATVHIEITGRD